MRKDLHKYKVNQMMYCAFLNKYVVIEQLLSDQEYNYRVLPINSGSHLNVFEFEIVEITEAHELLYI